jgi:hypothetical protein
VRPTEHGPLPGDGGAPEQPCLQWSDVRNTGNELPILELWASDRMAVAVGAYGSITRWNGETRSIDSQGSLDHYLDVSRAATGEVWIGGRASDDVWAVGTGGTVVHHDGTAWTSQQSGTAQSLNAIWGNPHRLWAVGEHGSILVKD